MSKKALRRVKSSLMRHRPFNGSIRAVSTGRDYIWPVVSKWLRWINTSPEDSNFTYDLTSRCKITMAASLASILNREYAEISRYFDEIESDEAFRRHIEGLWTTHPHRHRTAPTAKIGRRAAWYAIARTVKPAVIVETGVDQGMGAVVLCAALARNAGEGHHGKYFGTDINPQAGYYLKGHFADYGKILYGDSLDSLRSLSEICDLFINDSDHSADYERAEYEAIKPKLSPTAILLGDNSHVTAELAEFSMREGRKFIFLQEEPADHWYRGAGVGISYSTVS